MKTTQLFPVAIFIFISLFASPAWADTNPLPRLTVELRDGSRVVGASVEKNFMFHSALLGEIKLDVKDIRSIESADTNSVKLSTVNGDALTVTFVDSDFAVETSFGKVKLAVASVREISVASGRAAGAHPPGLVALWSGEGDGTDSVNDNNGTLIGGASFVPGKVGQAFSFNGTGSFVSIPDSPSLDEFTDSITIELWIKVKYLAANSDWVGIVTKGNAGWRLMSTSGAKTIYFADPGISTDIVGTRDINDGQWHHVAAVYNGANLYLYVDGTLDVSKSASGSISRGNHPVWLGYNLNENNGVPYPFDGLLDEVSLYKRALSSDEIRRDYEAGN